VRSRSPGSRFPSALTFSGSRVPSALTFSGSRVPMVLRSPGLPRSYWPSSFPVGRLRSQLAVFSPSWPSSLAGPPAPALVPQPLLQSLRFLAGSSFSSTGPSAPQWSRNTCLSPAVSCRCSEGVSTFYFPPSEKACPYAFLCIL
jgi:hypothetical protein